MEDEAIEQELNHGAMELPQRTGNSRTTELKQDRSRETNGLTPTAFRMNARHQQAVFDLLDNKCGDRSPDQLGWCESIRQLPPQECAKQRPTIVMASITLQSASTGYWASR